MSISIKKNKEPKLSMPTFTIDTILDKKLNQYSITSLMNKSNFTLFLGRAGSGKTSLMTSFLKTKDLFHRVYFQIFLFMPSTSRSSMKDGFFDKALPEEQIFDNVDFEDLQEVYYNCEANKEDEKNSLIIFDDVQKYLKQNDIQKLLLHIINNRRHLRTSIWICAQNYLTIPKMIRSGLTSLFIFKCSKKEMETIHEEQIELLDKNDFLDVVKNHCFKEPHDFFYLNRETNRLFCNWNEIIFF
jgi:hypothetical protein